MVTLFINVTLKSSGNFIKMIIKMHNSQ